MSLTHRIRTIAALMDVDEDEIRDARDDAPIAPCGDHRDCHDCINREDCEDKE